MKIIVTRHAIQRYRERLFNYCSTDEEIAGFLEKIARDGRYVGPKPGSLLDCFEKKYRGISVVLISDGSRCFVITCLGEASYRKWIKAKEVPGKISRRICYS